MRLDKDTKIEDIVVGTHQRSHICIAIPTLGMVPIEFVVAFGRLQLPVNGAVENIILKGMEVGAARNYAIEAVLRRPLAQRPKYVFFLGDDMLPPWDGLIRLSEEMEAGNWDCLCGLYYWKGEPPTPLTWRNDFIGRLLPGKHYQIGEKIWVDVTGMDFTLLRVSTLERMQNEIGGKFFQSGPGFRTNGEERAQNSMLVTYGKEFVVRYTEDVFFCQKLKKIGGKIGVDTTVRVSHLDVKTGNIY